MHEHWKIRIYLYDESLTLRFNKHQVVFLIIYLIVKTLVLPLDLVRRRVNGMSIFTNFAYHMSHYSSSQRHDDDLVTQKVTVTKSA